MSEKKIEKSIALKQYAFGRNWMFGYPSATIDRFTPGVEEIYLPQAATAEGTLKLVFEPDNHSTSSSQLSARKVSLNPLKASDEIALEDRVIGIDLRLNSPQNWAHAFTNHLPLALLIKKTLAQINANLCVILPSNIPPKIKELFSLSGFSCTLADQAVKGRMCHFKLEPWTSIRGERCDIIRDGLKDSDLIRKSAESSFHEDKIFLSRKAGRTLENEREVRAFLNDKGFITVFPEELSLVDQISCLANARAIIAIHGAGLGPLITRSAMGGAMGSTIKSAMSNSSSYKLLELFSPAHISTAYRAIAWQQNAEWASVRGKLWPELFSAKANFVTNMENYEISLASLEMAMTQLRMTY